MEVMAVNMKIVKLCVFYHPMSHFCFSFLCFVMLVRVANAAYSFKRVRMQECKNNQFFDVSSLGCHNCPENSRRNNDGVSCVCTSLYNASFYLGGIELTCLPCENQMVQSADGWSCIETCESTDAYSINVERYLNGTLRKRAKCEPCVGDTHPDATGMRCVRCHQSYINATNSCTCSPPAVEADGMCFVEGVPVLPNVESLYLTKYQDRSVKSHLLKYHYRGSAAMCQAAQNFTACQILGNLCVLTQYNNLRAVSRSPCSQFVSIDNSLDKDRNEERKNALPFIYYKVTSSEVLYSGEVEIEFSFKLTSPNSKMKFQIARYGVLGSFLGFQEVTGSTLQLCGGTAAELDSIFTFGTKYKKSCTISTRQIWNYYNTELWDLFLIQGKQNDMLYPVPVVVLNYQENGDFVNREENGGWLLTRRFFLVDNVMAKENPSQKASFVRYAKSMELVIILQSDTTNGRISSPYLKIDYADIPFKLYENDSFVQVEFSVSYKMVSRSSYRAKIETTLVILCGLAAVWAFVRTWAWSKRAGRQAIDFQTAIKLVLFACSSIANVFFVVWFGTTFWWLILFKNQDKVQYLLPNEDEESGFIQYICAAFVLKCIDLLHLFVNQVTVDIFLIDWEKPKGKIAVPGPQQSEGTTKMAPISIWRTYFVANEWNELQTLRKINPTLQVISVVFFLHVIGFENVAIYEPQSSFSKDLYMSNVPSSRTARFAIAVAVYIIVAIVQWFFFSFIYERLIEDKIRQFVDLCSVSNVSVFILQYDQYGYYIHGRSVSGVADTDMLDMYQQLKREEQSLRQNRGLLPNTEQQTFQIGIPRKLRLQYDRVFTTLISNQPAQVVGGASGGPQTRSMGDMRFEQCIHAYVSVGKFLSAFIDNSLRDVDYVVKERLLLEGIFDLELYDTFENNGVFFRDNGHAFDRVLFYGNELTILLFDILLFCVIDFLTQDFVLTGIITYLVIQAISILRYMGGKKNLAKKSLVDERFLI